MTDWFTGALITNDVLMLAWNINIMEKIFKKLENNVAVKDEDDEGEVTARPKELRRFNFQFTPEVTMAEIPADHLSQGGDRA